MQLKKSFKQLTTQELFSVYGGSCGQKIKYYREKMHMTQKELAQQLFVSQQTIHKWEYDINEPSLEIIKKLKIIFHQSADNIID